MNVDELKDFFEANNDEYLKFEHVENKKSKRADVHAFILLDSLVDDESDIVGAAEHDIIYLPDLEDVCPHITEEQALELIRCGISIDSSLECFFSFV